MTVQEQPVQETAAQREASFLERMKGVGLDAFPKKPIRAVDATHGLSHAEYVDLVFPELTRVLFDTPDSEYPDLLAHGFSDIHIDKSYQYFDEWELEGMDLNRASVIYLLTYTNYIRSTPKEQSSQWVIENYNVFAFVLHVIEHRLGLIDHEPDFAHRIPIAAANRYRHPRGYYFTMIAARHWSPGMHVQWDVMKLGIAAAEKSAMRQTEEQGFTDQRDNFLSREHAYVLARVHGLLNKRRRKSGSVGEPILWSEDIH